jgi:small subunit ribosomal protein S17
MEKTHKTRIGQVVSKKTDKTVIVEVTFSRRDPLYDKRVVRSSRWKAQDESNKCKLGDTVRIVETRPLSKDKHWRVKEIVSSREVIEIVDTPVI